MSFADFFQAFHTGNNEGYLRDCTTTRAIPKFFAEHILRDEESRNKLPTDDDSYDKWFHNAATPRNHLNNFRKNYREELLVADLMAAIDDRDLRGLLRQFEIPDDEEENKHLLCTAIARQLKALIDGKGRAAPVIKDIYLSGNLQAPFTAYTEKAVARYSVMKLTDGNAIPLEDVFVRPTVGEKERVFSNPKNRPKCSYLEDPTLDSIRTVFQHRGYDNSKTVIIGRNGTGKSAMLQNMFVRAANAYKKTGILPVFLELRYFKQSDTLFSFLVQTVREKDGTFTAEHAHRLLLSGRCQLLLDGFDEIDPSDVNVFLHTLEQFSDQYGKVQIVLSSRATRSLSGLNGYTRLYIWPFNTEQSEQLVDRLLACCNASGKRDAVLKFVHHGFMQKDGILASNPLLLSFVTLKYSQYERYRDNSLLFYRAMYKEILTGHDDNKKPYDRVFKSVDDATQFTIVFREFCALTFRDGSRQFDSSLFEYYFNQLRLHKAFRNPHKMNSENFRSDLCSTACVMYEREDDLFYIDPGFQEFLFAEYYAQSGKEELKELLQSLKKLNYKQILRFDALDMLMSQAPEKFKLQVLLPFLENSLRGTDELHSFQTMLETCFDELHICICREASVAAAAAAVGATEIRLPRIDNYPSTILLNYILRLNGENEEHPFLLSTVEMPSGACAFSETGKLVGRIAQNSVERVLVIENLPLENYQYLQAQPANDGNGWLTDENGEPVCFGSCVEIDTYSLFDCPENYYELTSELKDNSPGTRSVFEKILRFRQTLKIERYRRER